MQEIIRVQDTVIVSIDQLILVFIFDFRGICRLELGEFFRITFFIIKMRAIGVEYDKEVFLQ